MYKTTEESVEEIQESVETEESEEIQEESVENEESEEVQDQANINRASPSKKPEISQKCMEDQGDMDKSACSKWAVKMCKDYDTGDK